MTAIAQIVITIALALGGRPPHQSVASCICHECDRFPVWGALRTKYTHLSTSKDGPNVPDALNLDKAAYILIRTLVHTFSPLIVL